MAGGARREWDVTAMREETMTTVELGAFLRRMRKEAGIPQAALAERMGKSQPQISQLETGERANPTFGTLVEWAEAMGLVIEVGFRPRDLVEADGTAVTEGGALVVG